MLREVFSRAATPRKAAVTATPAETLTLVTRAWLLAAVTLAVAAHVTHLPLWISLTVATVLLLQTARRARDDWTLPRLLATPVTLAVALGLVLEYRSLFGREVGVALLVLMLTLKLVELRRARDATLVIYLAYFTVVTHSLYSQSLPITLYQLVGLIVITAALLVRNARGPVRPLRQALVLLGQAIPLMLILFVLFPRISGPLWRLPSDAHTGVTGISGEMSPGSFSQLAQSDAVALRVDFSGPAPANDQRYWRGPVFWEFDGRTWTAGDLGGVRARQGSDLTGGATLDYRVTQEPSGQSWLFALDVPLAIDQPVGFSPGQVLHSPRRIEQRVVYQASSRIGATLIGLTPLERHRALSLPPVSARVAALAERIRATGGDDAGVVAQALTHLHDSAFVYTLNPPLLQQDPVDEFLFETRRGFCEHYASAFTVLMRAAGIPARVVTGYLGMEYNALGDYWIVRQSDAHAWSEVWLDGEGWRRIDPTAAVAPTRIETQFNPRLAGADSGVLTLADDNPLTRAARRLRLGIDALNHTWHHWVIQYDQTRQRNLLAALGLGDGHWRSLALLLLVASAGFIILLAAWLLWRQPVTRDPVLATYQRWCRYLARRGLARSPHEPPAAYAARLSNAHPARAQAIDTITRLYLLLRYGRPRQTEARLADLRREVARFRC